MTQEPVIAPTVVPDAQALGPVPMEYGTVNWILLRVIALAVVFESRTPCVVVEPIFVCGKFRFVVSVETMPAAALPFN